MIRRPADAAVATAIASAFFRETVREVTPLVGKGIVNRIFIVETDSARLVVRMHEDESEAENYVKEAWCLAQAAHIVPHFDLINLLMYHRHWNSPDAAGLQAFLEGYGLTAADTAAILPELESLLLLRAFDKLRWAIDRSPDDIPDFVITARQTLHWKLHSRNDLSEGFILSRTCE